MGLSSKNYHAMMLRLWRDEHSNEWHASIQNPHTGETRHFATFEQCTAYLQSQIANEPNAAKIEEKITVQ